jgi:hypothetical protein
MQTFSKRADLKDVHHKPHRSGSITPPPPKRNTAARDCQNWRTGNIPIINATEQSQWQQHVNNANGYGRNDK